MEMAGTTHRSGGARFAQRRSLRGLNWTRDLHIAPRRLLAILAGALLACALLSGPAWGRIPGAVRAASETKAPKVTLDPKSVIVEEGQSASFEAAASGAPAPSVQWEISTNGGSKFVPVAGATSDKLTIASATTSESGDQYRAVFTNGIGNPAISKAALLTVQLRPTVTKQPASVTLEEGHNATFEATASGFPAPTVQWEVSTDGGKTWGNVRRASSDVLTVASVKTSEDGDEYRAVFKNAAALEGVATEAATLTVHNHPVVTKQPLSVTVEEGQGAHFEASASGFPAPSVEWELSTDEGASFTPIEGATADLLAIAGAKTSENGDEYRAVFENAAGIATTAVVTLTVHNRPVLTSQPENVTVEVGASASFEASASGFPTPTVQWEVSSNGGTTFTPVAGGSSDQLTIAEATAAENGDEYRAVFTNLAGKATSEVATLTVSMHHFRVLSWGGNSFGQLGNGTLKNSALPVTVTELNFATAIAAGKRHSLAILADGTVVAWGDGASGQLGDGVHASSVVPETVEGLTHVKAIAAGDNFSLALLSNGTVAAWGANEEGQLGNGTKNESDVPVAVEHLTGVTAIAAGGEHAMALLSNGTVMTWGAGEQGQLGNGQDNNSDVPVAVKGLTKVTAIAAGREHCLALITGGTVMAWGSDEFGQLGDPAFRQGSEEAEELVVMTNVPVTVEGLSGVSAVSAGAHFNLALLTGGTAMAWGEDESGQLGDGSIIRIQEAPVAVSGLSGATAISAGGEHSMALLGGGTVMTWGEDKDGELGNAIAGEPSDVPETVSSLGQVVGIAAGGLHDLVYSEPLPSVTAVNPTAGAVGGGTPVTITGSNLEGATAVHFGANSALSFTVHSPSSITAVAPAGALGTVDVTVSIAAGTSPITPADHFSYVPPPTVTALSSKAGPGAGESTVTISGSEFQAATGVDFGANPAEKFVINSPTSITAVSPPGAGTVSVTVTAPGGTSPSSKHDQFEYIPAVTNITPSSGPHAGATSVTITGAGFAVGTGTTTFKFGKGAATEVKCSSTSTCTATTPASKKLGAVEVIAAVGKAKSAANPPGDQFTYE
jgi:alpha-tubulin suppressor-like RCC1 family protein